MGYKAYSDSYLMSLTKSQIMSYLKKKGQNYYESIN